MDAMPEAELHKILAELDIAHAELRAVRAGLAHPLPEVWDRAQAALVNAQQKVREARGVMRMELGAAPSC